MTRSFLKTVARGLVGVVLMTQVIGFSTVIFPYQVGPLVVAMQMSGEKLGHLLRITLPLALITFLTFPLLAQLGYVAKEGFHNSPEAIYRLEWVYIAGPIFFVHMPAASAVEPCHPDGDRASWPS